MVYIFFAVINECGWVTACLICPIDEHSKLCESGHLEIVYIHHYNIYIAFPSPRLSRHQANISDQPHDAKPVFLS